MILGVRDLGMKMAVTIRGTSYRLLRCLREHSRTKIFLAQSDRGEIIVLKCHMDPDLFFDELARYYACSESPNLAKVLQNYPPFFVSGNRFAFQEDLVRAFFPESGGVDGSIDPPAEVGQMGCLVLEHLPGEPFNQVMGRLTSEERIPYFRELVKAVAKMHQAGEFHGQLIPANVLVDEASGKLFLVGLDYCPGRTQWDPRIHSPEQARDQPQEAGPWSDVYMLAKNFILPFAWPQKRIQQLSQACLKPNPKHRPSLAGLGEAFGVAVAPAQKKVKSRLAMKWSMVASVLMVSLIGVTVSRPNLIWDMRDRWVLEAETNNEEATRRQALESLFSLYGTSGSQKLSLAADIARVKKTLADHRVFQLSEADQRPLAVFEFNRMPLVLGQMGILEIGDWIEFEGKEGFIAEINKRAMTIQHGERAQTFSFRKPNIPFKPNINFPGVVIWDLEENLVPILRDLPEVAAALREEASAISGGSRLALLFGPRALSMRIFPDQVYGFYQTESFPEFLLMLERQLEIEGKEDQIHIARSKDSLPLHLPYPEVGVGTTNLRTLQDLCAIFTRDFGIPFIPETGSASETLPIRVFQNKTYQSIFEGLGYAWDIQEEDGALRVLVH